MPRFKQRIEVDAWQFTNSTKDDRVPDWVDEAMKKWPDFGGIKIFSEGSLANIDMAHVDVHTGDGVIPAFEGDWIVRHYGCRPLPVNGSDFERLYEPVIEPSP